MVNDGQTNSQPDAVAITVLPPLPLLSIARSGTDAILSWSTNDAAFQLQSTSNFDSTATWSNVPGTPTISGNQLFQTDPFEDKKFYRLSSP